MAILAPEATRMPIGVHSLYHPSDDEFTAFPATRREQHMEIVLAVFPTFEFKENSILENLEALSAHKALLMPQLSSRINNLLIGFKTLTTASAEHVV